MPTSAIHHTGERAARSGGRATRALLTLIAGAALLWAAGATAGPRVVGGAAIDIQQAPWQVLMTRSQSGQPDFVCGGSILDANRIVTAAHCVFHLGGSPAPPSALSIRAGISNYATPKPTDSPQDRGVSSVRIHPGFNIGQIGSSGDVAVLHLNAPLDLSGPTAQTIGLPPANAVYEKGRAVNLAGFGRQSGGAAADGSLQWITTALTEQANCDGGVHNAVILCAASPANTVCAGDSGSGLVIGRTLVGITSTGAVQCPLGAVATFTNVAAPEILRFIQGSDNPPVAPRRLRPAQIVFPPPLQVGQTMNCTAGSWTGQPKLTFIFRTGAGAVLQRSTRAFYRLKPRDRGQTIGCRVIASNAGGTGFAQTRTTPRAVQPPPRIAAARASGLPGRRAVVGVTLTGMRLVRGNARVCAAPLPRAAARNCVQTRLRGTARVRINVPVAIKAAAPRGRTVRVGVTVRLGDGRTLATAARLQIR